MSIPNIQIIETIVAIAVYMLLKFLADKSIDKTVTRNLMDKTRAKVVKKAANFILLLTLFFFILIVWGVDRSELALFVGSVLTVIGIALFAQWSILSNITAGIILFFNHSVKLDDHINVIDKDFNIAGRVSDIGLFFVILKTKEGEIVSIPSNVFIQKMIKKRPNSG
jgi:small-conductance mechanosensitive channel